MAGQLTAGHRPGWLARKWRLLGPLSLSCCLCEVALGKALGAVFKLDPWHGAQGFHCRSYKLVAARMANALAPRVVVDVGCGLGDVLVHVNAQRRYGLDPDPRVIRAAKLCRGRRATFLVGSIGEMAALPEDRVDLLVMLGWVHLFSRAEARSMVRQPLIDVFDRVQIEHVLVDEYSEDYGDIDPERRGQAIVEMLMELGGTVMSSQADEEGRVLRLIKMTGV